jgi:hypothetical protein
MGYLTPYYNYNFTQQSNQKPFPEFPKIGSQVQIRIDFQAILYIPTYIKKKKATGWQLQNYSRMAILRQGGIFCRNHGRYLYEQQTSG